MPSVYPCDVHGARIRGALEGLRVTLLRKPSRYSRKLRVCPADVDELLRTHSQEWIEIDDDGLATTDALCGACREPVPAGSNRGDAFVYLWRRNSPQREFYAVYCSSCCDRLIRDFGLVEESYT